MIGDTFEAGREHLIEDKIVASVNHHFVSKLAEMREGVGCPRVAVKGGHYKFPQESEHGDFL